MLPQLSVWAKSTPLALTLLTGLNQPAFQALSAGLQPLLHSDFTVRYRPWQPETGVFPSLAETDLVVLPADLRTMKPTASHNRLTEALWAGRFVVAGPVPAYTEFAETAWIGEDVVAGLDWVLANPEEAIARTERGQELIDRDFVSARVARDWLAVMAP